MQSNMMDINEIRVFSSCLNTYNIVIYRILILEEGGLLVIVIFLLLYFVLCKPIFGYNCLQRENTTQAYLEEMSETFDSYFG